jgi:hypothetical protein
VSGLSIATVLEELVDSLTNVSGLSEWFVCWGEAGDEVPPKTIEIGLGAIPWTEEDLGLGGHGPKLEEYVIPGSLFYAEPGGAEGLNATKKAALENAVAVFAVVEAYINEHWSETEYLSAAVTGGTVTQGPYAGDFNGRWAQVDFNIHIETQKTP